MRSRALSLWLALIVLLAAELAVYKMAGALAGYSRQIIYRDFAAGSAICREVTGLPYAGIINQAGQTYGISPVLVAAIITAESSFQPQALSKAGAYGLMQIMPATWRQVNTQIKVCSGRHTGDCGNDCFYNPELNIAIGTYYLSQLSRRFAGRTELAVAAYNAGPGAIDRYSGIPPYAETTEYVERVINYWYQLNGNIPPGYLAADRWDGIVIVAGWGMLATAAAVISMTGWLYRRHKSWRWR